MEIRYLTINQNLILLKITVLFIYIFNTILKMEKEGKIIFIRN